MSVEKCIEEKCGGEIFCRNMCLKHYKKWYYSVKLNRQIKSEYQSKMAKLGIPSLLYLTEPTLIRKGNRDYIPFSQLDRESHIIHETPIFALALGSNYKSIPPVLTIENYGEERTVGNHKL